MRMEWKKRKSFGKQKLLVEKIFGREFDTDILYSDRPFLLQL